LSVGISSLSLIGYLYGAKALYTITAYTAIAFQTALFIFFVSLGIVLGIRESGPMRLFNDNGPAGILTRRLVPPLIMLPILIGAIRLIGERLGYYDLAFGSAMRTVVEIGLLLGVVWWAGTALAKQAKQVEDSQKTVRQLADAMPQVVWMSDSTGAVEYYNDRASQFAGIRRNKEGKYDWQPGLHPDDLEATIESWKRAVEQADIYAQEHRILMADGSFRWHLSRAIPASRQNGDDPKWFGTATDIHDLKTAEHALRESEQRFSRFMQNLPGLAWIKDRDGRYVFANDAAQKAFGKTAAELYGKTDSEIFPTDTAAAFVENDRQAMESDHGRQTIESLKDEDGILRYSLVNKFPIHVNGEPSLIGGMAIDITEQKTVQDNQAFLFRIADKIRVARNAEDLLADIAIELGEFLRLHRCLFNEIDLDSDTETVHRDYSRTGESVSGVHKISAYSSVSSEAMAVGNTIVNNDSQNDPRTAEYFEKTYGPNKELAYVTVPMMREGRWVASLWCSDDRPREWTNHEITLIEGIAERAWVAVERLRSDVISAKLAAIVQSSDDAIISKDLNGIITSWNRGAEKIFGYTEEEVLGKPITILIPQDRTEEEPGILRRIRNGESIDHYETIRVDKDGKLLDISLTVSPIYDAEGRVIGASKVARDITERMAAEKEIQMISRMPEENPNPVMRVTPAGEILYANPSAQPVIQYWGRVFGREIPEDFRWCVARAFETGSKQTIDIVYDDRFLSCNLAPVLDGGYVNVYADDITDRQKAEELMRLSEERYRTLFSSMDEGYCIIEVIFDDRGKPVDYRFIEVNPAFEEQARMHDVIGKRMLEFVDEIEEHWLTNYGKVASTGVPVRFSGEYKGLKSFFEVYAFRIGDEGDNRVAVLFTNITARIEAENALRISEERYRALTELSPQFVFLSTPEGAITYVNQVVVDFTGLEFDELLGHGWTKCIRSDVRGSELNKWRDALKNGDDY
jgi:PAS domain S-box-containing protein